ncbi:uncharacterized protein [Parasteatoda tepidariorum]|uniref:uncharacterized protein n=1 Tax=Parasteatoda tepidariorum TaxID=114398 RepID=UPI00077F8EA0|nr:uncharacterized protein LOC107452470 [Parasteatoda tepidariorum]
MEFNNDTIRRLFNNVLYEDIRQHQLNHADIRTGIQNMKEVYKPNPSSLSSEFLDVANYNDPAHRCAYLHKYAPLHTALVSDMLNKSMQEVRFILQEIIADTGRLEVCSLGGGPGSDVLGVTSVLSAELGFFQFSATIVDCMGDWRYTFAAIIKELRCGSYGLISEFVQPQYFSWNYIGHNLLGKMNNDVNKAIQGANLVTMVKFVSAAACKDTAEMLKKIFRSLKPGALVLFIDNDAGGFYRLALQGAKESGMVTVFGPLIHEHYVNKSFNVRKFGYTPCLETKVTVHMWMKPNYNRSTVLPATTQRNPSSVQIKNVTNTFNQYNIINTNIYVTETNNLNLPYGIPHQTYLPKQSQQNDANQLYIPIQRQYQDHILPSSSSVTKNLNNTQPKKTIQKARQQNVGNQPSLPPIQRALQGNTSSSGSTIRKNSNLSLNNPQRIQNPNQQNGTYQSSQFPVQQQPRHSSNNYNSSDNPSNYGEGSEICCNCCVIS